MSPHGSKLKELVRFLANRFLSDAQRKKIKNALARLQQIPVKLLGIQGLIQAQQDEIARLKSKVTILDGKLNIALYGMPQIQPQFRAISLSASTLNQYDSTDYVLPVTSDPVRVKAILQVSSIQSAGFKSSLILGESDLGFLRELLEGLPSLSELAICDDIEQNLDKAQQIFKSYKKDLKVENFSTTLMNALMAIGSRSFDLILCANRFHQLAPSEQIRFLHLAEQKLSDSGFLILVLPDLSSQKVRDDLYWRDTRSLRLYSMSAIREFFQLKEGVLKVVQASEQTVIVSFQKVLKKS